MGDDLVAVVAVDVPRERSAAAGKVITAVEPLPISRLISANPTFEVESLPEHFGPKAIVIALYLFLIK